MNGNGISIIIPVLNEAAIIEKTLNSLNQQPNIEIIIVDGGSDDHTVTLVESLGFKVISCPQRGRASQMNLGAQMATGDILLFLHADTCVPPDYQQWIQKTLSLSHTVAGAFSLVIDSPRFSRRLIEIMANWRSRFCSLPYGDQAIFLKTATFWELGGFAQLPIMEDFEIIQRLKRKGKITIVPAPVLTSDRRWRKLGVVKTTLINQLVIMGYYLGVSPAKLARLYRKK